MPDLVRTARPIPGLWVLAAVLCALTVAGCASWIGTEPAHQNKIVEHYNRLAANVAQLDPCVQSPEPTPSIGDGRELIPPKLEDRWPLSLAEALRLGLENNAIIRQNAQFMSPTNPVMRSPDAVPSVYDSLIQNSGVLFGSRGVDAAKSDFDPRLTVTMKSGEDMTVDNTTIAPIPPGNVLNNNYTQYQSKIEQTLLSGGLISINQNWNYGLSNQQGQLFNSAYTGVLGAEFRQPLWSGSGKFFTSVAGPANQRARGFSNVSQGIVIAHINKRLSEIDLQENLQNLAREIGDLYWDLYRDYQIYTAEHLTAKVAKDLWDRLTSREYQESGVDVAQAEDTYFESRGREELALSNLYLTEGRLRRLLRLPINDTRLIFPSDEPREKALELNRSMCLYEALVNRIELTRQKTNLHSLQLQLRAAQKLVAPKFDFVSGYALNGFGNNFYSPNTTATVNGTPNNFNSAVSNLYTGRETSWSAGFEYSIPLWLRQERAQVHQLEFRIMKAKMALAIQEDEISHELNTVLMNIRSSQKISNTARERVQAARKRVLAAQSAYEGGFKNADVYLRALTSQSQAQLAYARSIADYNKSLRDLLFRTGRLLPADGIAVMGVDGLPLMSPANPEMPFEELQKPPEPNEPGPDQPSPADPKSPDDKSDPNLLPKPKKKPSVAEGDGEGTNLSAVMPSSFDLLAPPGTLDDLLADTPQELKMELPLKIPEVLEEHLKPEDELSDTVIPIPGDR